MGMKRGFKRNSIVVPILNDEYKVIVLWGEIKNVRKTMKGWGYTKPAEQKDFDSRRGVTFYAKDCHPCIVLPKFPHTAEEVGTLSHEAVHAVANILEKINSRYDDEVFAHSVGAVVRKVISLKNK